MANKYYLIIVAPIVYTTVARPIPRMWKLSKRQFIEKMVEFPLPIQEHNSIRFDCTIIFLFKYPNLSGQFVYIFFFCYKTPANCLQTNTETNIVPEMQFQMSLCTRNSHIIIGFINLIDFPWCWENIRNNRYVSFMTEYFLFSWWKCFNLLPKLFHKIELKSEIFEVF